jgi:hypothetical protein
MAITMLGFNFVVRVRMLQLIAIIGDARRKDRTAKHFWLLLCVTVPRF